MILQTSAIDQCCPADDESPDTEHEIEDMPRPCTMQNTGSGQGLRAEMAALREQVAELLVSNAQGATYEFSSEPAPPIIRKRRMHTLKVGDAGGFRNCKHGD